MRKRGYDLPKLKAVSDDLINERALSPLRRDHALTGPWEGFRDCHIESDWILIYRIDPISNAPDDGPKEAVTFARTGTHSDIF